MNNKIKHFGFFNNTDKFVVAVNNMYGLVSQEQAKQAQTMLADDDFFDLYVGSFEIVAPNTGAKDGEPITNYQAIDVMDYLDKLKSRKEKNFVDFEQNPSLAERLASYKFNKLSQAKQAKYMESVFDSAFDNL